MKRGKKILFICVMGVILGCSSNALAKPISNSLTAEIKVINKELTVGSGVEYSYPTINDSINAAKEGQTIKIQGGTYSFDEIVDKDVTLQSFDGDYVDIEITGELPLNVKVDEKVTINKKGLSPIELKGLLGYRNVSGSDKTLSQETILEVQNGGEVKIVISQKVVNSLGFHDSHLILKLSEDTEVTVEKNADRPGKDTQVEAKGNGEYDLGAIVDKELTDIYLTFSEAGTYTVELWVDDGR